MYYIFHGPDEFSRTEELNKLRARMGDPQFAELNTTVLEGRSITLGALRHHADAIPFLSDKRLVIVEGLLTRLNPRQRKKEAEEGEPEEQEADPELAAALAEYLQHLPETTRLVFLEPKELYKNNPVLKAAEKDKKQAHVRRFPAPDPRDLPDWIIERAEQKQSRIEFSAANALAIHIGPDLRALDGELEKLCAFRGGETIRREDVELLVAPVQEQSIFEMVDALGKRETSHALMLLHDQLAHGAEPVSLLGMIVRQYRILLQVRDLVSRGVREADIRQKLGLHPFVVDKMIQQSRNYSLEQLEGIYGLLLETDIAGKTGKGDPVTNLDILVVELTQKTN